VEPPVPDTIEKEMIRDLEAFNARQKVEALPEPVRVTEAGTPIYKGPRGGEFFLNKSGDRVYISKLAETRQRRYKA
jgi:hypothetical protein